MRQRHHVGVGGGPLVLVLDDEPDLLRLWAAQVASAGCVPLACSHGRVALDLARARRPAAFVLDLVVPGLPGIEVAETLRAEGVAAPMLGASARPAEWVPAGVFDRYIELPFDLREAPVARWLIEVLGLPDRSADALADELFEALWVASQAAHRADPE
jgi:two-component system OmpR family response regulator